MKSEKVEKLLIERGYKRETKSLWAYPDYVQSLYFRVMYGVPDLPDCLCNDKPPQIVVQECYITHPLDSTHDIHSFQIGFNSQSPQGWADFDFSGLDESDVLTRIDEFETALLNAWRALFDEGKNDDK